jgi:hypothetical protein
VYKGLDRKLLTWETFVQMDFKDRIGVGVGLGLFVRMQNQDGHV